MDSTLKSNLSVGLPLDLLVYRAGSLACDQIVCIDEQNPYFRMIHNTWGQRLREVFEGIDDPRWDGGDTQHPLMSPLQRYEPMRKITAPGRAHRLMPGRKTHRAAGTLVFSHANGFPAGTYRLLFERWQAAGWRVLALPKFGHDPAFPVASNWPHTRNELIALHRARGAG